MSLNELINLHIANTGLNPVLVKAFLQTPPAYYQLGVLHNLEQSTLSQLIATDLFEFYLRLYLTGRHKTLQAVLREARLFAQSGAPEAPYLLAYSLEATYQALLTLEWYELLPRLRTAKALVMAMAPSTHDSSPPLVVDFLSTSGVH